LEINNWFDLIIYSIFTIGVLLIGIPSSIYDIKKGINAWIRFGCCTKLPTSFIISNNLETYGVKSALGIILLGLFLGISSFWYLFIDKEGNLFYWLKELKEFFS